MTVPHDERFLVEHVKTGAQGLLLEKTGRPPNVVYSVEFDHGVEEVPQSLLRPIWEPFELLVEGANDVVYPYDGWLRRERYRILDAFRNDTALGLSNARVDPQLHQVSVALRALEKPKPRLILADEVGLGKTIEAGLILKELRARMGSDLGRVLIMVPASLVNQWRFELRSKFNEAFTLLDGPEISRIKGERPKENPWEAEPNVICSLQLARMQRYAVDIAAVSWDVVIVDEAHHARRTLA